MKRIIVFLMCLCLNILTACASNGAPNSQVNSEDISAKLIDVMNNRKEFVAENGSKVYLQDYQIPDTYDVIKLNVETYTFVDLDHDDINELVLNATTESKRYLILHYNTNDSTIYGYSVGARSMIDIKTDGSFWGSGGAGINQILTLTFDQGKLNYKTIASRNDYNNIYQINNAPATEQEMREFLDQWNARESCKWIAHKTS